MYSCCYPVCDATGSCVLCLPLLQLPQASWQTAPWPWALRAGGCCWKCCWAWHRCDMLAYAATYCHMLAHAGIRWHMLAHAGIRWHMLAHAGTCWHMLAHADM